MAKNLPTLAEVSHQGWAPIYEGINDAWNSSDRSSGKCIIGANEVDFVRYNRMSEQTDTVVINHGGPFGTINEGWRYFFEPHKWNLVLPLQYREGLGHESQSNLAERIVSAGGLTRIVKSLHSVLRPLVTGKMMMAGSSWGGTVSLAFASVYPELISAVVVSSPLLPITRSISRLTARDGCFSENAALHDYFMRSPTENASFGDYNIFERYFDSLRSSKDGEIRRQFSSIFYAAMGDLGRNLDPAFIPRDGVSLERAMAFAFVAGQKKPFALDEHTFIRGLKHLKSRAVPIYIVTCRDDRFSNDEDIKACC